MKKTLLLLTLILAFGAGIVAGQAPRVITFQDFLAEIGGVNPVPDGRDNLTFRIYTADVGGTQLWVEPHTNVEVSRGLFRVFWGNLTPINLAFDAPYWLGVQIGAGAEVFPRTPLTSVGYSFKAMEADKVDGFDASATPAPNKLLPLDANGKFPANALPPATLVNGSVTETKLAPNAVTSAKIQDGQVQTVDLADSAVTQVKLAAGVFLPPGGIARGDLTGTYPNPSLAANAVTNAKIANNAVNSAKIEDEPGVASKTERSAHLLDGTVKALLSRGLTAPRNGYVLAIATAEINFIHFNGTSNKVTLGLSTSAGNFDPNNQYRLYFDNQVGTSKPTGTGTQYGIPITIHGLFAVTPGLTTTIYFLGQKIAPDLISFSRMRLTLIYLPTAYGAVELSSN